MYFQTAMGFGLLHTLDVAKAAEGLELAVWPLESLMAADMPKRFGYTRSPDAASKNQR